MEPQEKARRALPVTVGLCQSEVGGLVRLRAKNGGMCPCPGAVRDVKVQATVALGLVTLAGLEGLPA